MTAPPVPPSSAHLERAIEGVCDALILLESLRIEAAGSPALGSIVPRTREATEALRRACSELRRQAEQRQSALPPGFVLPRRQFA
jgi:hypothetical protein